MGVTGTPPPNFNIAWKSAPESKAPSQFFLIQAPLSLKHEIFQFSNIIKIVTEWHEYIYNFNEKLAFSV